MGDCNLIKGYCDRDGDLDGCVNGLEGIVVLQVMPWGGKHLTLAFFPAVGGPFHCGFARGDAQNCAANSPSGEGLGDRNLTKGYCDRDGLKVMTNRVLNGRMIFK
jgi:hypothetical protein